VGAAVARVFDQATSLTAEPAEQRELIGTAFEEYGRHPLLVLLLADLELDYGDRHACAALALEAMRGAPEDPVIVAESIRYLWLADYDADALRRINDLSKQFQNSPAFCQTAGRIYEHRRLRGKRSYRPRAERARGAELAHPADLLVAERRSGMEDPFLDLGAGERTAI